MNIIFAPLTQLHFPLLRKWLETPHVKTWWDHDLIWTDTLIQEKYNNYVKGYKIENGIAKKINAYVIYIDDTAIGYIQFYNAYDFNRSKPLTGLPSSLGALDIFIGEERYLKKGIASRAIVQFLKEQVNLYTHIFVDPQDTNLAAIRTYEKAGFKKIKEQTDTNEIWMIRQQTKRPDPLLTIKKLIQERYSTASAVFWAGSVSQNAGTNASDLDLVIVFDELPNAYREAFIFDDWPIDAFIHDINTLRYFLEESKTGNGISGTITMILNGQEITAPNAFSNNIKALAKKVLKEGPVGWGKKQIDTNRFLITDVLDDIKYPVSCNEQVASAAWLFEALGQFYFRSQNKWCASGKSIVRYLQNDDPSLAMEFNQAFETLFQTGNSVLLESLVKKILAPYGGLLWNGFTSHASKEAKRVEKYDD